MVPGRVTENNNKINYDGNLQELLDYFKDKPVPNFKSQSNKSHYLSSVLTSNTSFTGGHYENIYGRQDMRMFEEVSKLVSSDKTVKKTIQSIAEVQAPKRQRCSYDGDYDIDKKWEAEPFLRRKKSLIQRRIIKLHASLSFSAFVGADTINRYGAFVASIVNILESSGVLVELFVFQKAESMAHKPNVSYSYESNVKIKRADEYLPPQEIVRVFNSNFFRRIGFALMITSSDAIGANADGSLGRPAELKGAFVVDGDKVYLNNMTDINSQNNFLDNLLKIVKREGE